MKVNCRTKCIKFCFLFSVLISSIRFQYTGHIFLIGRSLYCFVLFILFSAFFLFRFYRNHFFRSLTVPPCHSPNVLIVGVLSLVVQGKL